MKPIYALILIVFLGHIQPEQISKLEEDNFEFQFQDQEKLYYNIYVKTGFIWFSVGEVIFETNENELDYDLSIKAFTYPRWSKLYNISFDLSSVVDKASNLPNTFVRESYKRDIYFYDSISMDQTNLVAEEYYGTDKSQLKNHDVELENTVFDVVSLLYQLRRSSEAHMEIGSKIPIPFIYNRRQYQLDFNCIEKENHKLSKDLSLEASNFQVKAIKGIHFDKNDYVNIWISEKLNRIPILFELPLKIGTLKIVLKEGPSQ